MKPIKVELNKSRDRITITSDVVTYQLSISHEGLILDLVTDEGLECIFDCMHEDFNDKENA